MFKREQEEAYLIFFVIKKQNKNYKLPADFY